MNESIVLHIENLCFEAIIGVLPQERIKPQKLIIEAHITYIYDDECYLNYAKICEQIEHYIQSNTYGLLESALIDISHKLKAHFSNITHLTLCIKKPQILAPCVVGASITKVF
ncbi:dihydroneopterin aldolase [Helicobacter marmotae]|uniref:Dihydroneopterin aldolase n=1 Tax=Helicobacter marmotae TaxID=152490 RepID=A0A3D8I3L4_9HELI|nr:dihydroneopterin aldolase [Helicobacter marmotae]RDU59722.1 dihydroneopterin aldolase [Helicobacter marmotae]